MLQINPYQANIAINKLHNRRLSHVRVFPTHSMRQSSSLVVFPQITSAAAAAVQLTIVHGGYSFNCFRF